jgi:hypothetical protein
VPAKMWGWRRHHKAMKAELVTFIVKLALASIPVVFAPQLAIEAYRKAKAELEAKEAK